MPRRSLPVIDPKRTEFDFCRTVCSCPDCTQFCHHLPGYLIPADLERIYLDLSSEKELVTWAKEHLRASPGAVVMRHGKVFRIPTLVPARRTDGACIFLTDDEQCSIHAIAPFGCAFFDAHQAGSIADQRSSRGLSAVLGAWLDHALYAQIWNALYLEGLVAVAPEEIRCKLEQEQKKIS